jgi:hypothetical protein
MNNSLEQANNLLNYYEETQIKLREEITKLQKEANADWLITLDMYMYCLRYTHRLSDVYKTRPYQFYKDEVLEMMHKFEGHAANNKDSRLFKLNISIIEYCTEAYKEMEKIPVQ